MQEIIKKLLIQFLFFIFLLFSVWFVLSKINWMAILKVEQATKNTEEKIGDLLWDLLKKSESEITSLSIVSPVDSMLSQICIRNHIDRSGIKFHLLRKEEVNAFAFPNNHLIIYSGLLSMCENEAEFCGVLCHELAHMQKRHIMNKLLKDFGLSMLISMSAGSGNSEMIRAAVKHLSSTAYDRNLENEADMTAVEYLIKANIDPEQFANFLFRLSNQDGNLPAQYYWITTHPASKERAEKIVEKIKNRTVLKIPVLNESRWILLKKKLNEME